MSEQVTVSSDTDPDVSIISPPEDSDDDTTPLQHVQVDTTASSSVVFVEEVIQSSEESDRPDDTLFAPGEDEDLRDFLDPDTTLSELRNVFQAVKDSRGDDSGVEILRDQLSTLLGANHDTIGSFMKVVAFFGFAAWVSEVSDYEMMQLSLETQEYIDQILKPVVHRIRCKRPNVAQQYHITPPSAKQVTNEQISASLVSGQYVHSILAFFRDIPKAQLSPERIEELLPICVYPFLLLPTVSCLLELCQFFGYTVDNVRCEGTVLLNSACPVGRRAQRNKVIRALCALISQGPSPRCQVVVPDEVKHEASTLIPEFAPEKLDLDDDAMWGIAEVLHMDAEMSEVLNTLQEMRDETNERAVKCMIYQQLIPATRKKTLGELIALIYYSGLPCQEVPRAHQAILLKGGKPFERSAREDITAAQHIDHQANQIAEKARLTLKAAEQASGIQHKRERFVPTTRVYDNHRVADYEPEKGVDPDQVAAYADAIGFHLVGVSYVIDSFQCCKATLAIPNV